MRCYDFDDIIEALDNNDELLDDPGRGGTGSTY